MLYQCRQCEHVEARGCLPTVTCGIYFVGLMGCASALCGAVAVLMDWWFMRDLLPGPKPDLPWWVWLISVCVSLPLTLLGAIALDYLFRPIEYFAVRRMTCPKCGARFWSKGYTSGFGL